MATSCTTIIPVRWLRPRTWQLAFSAVLAIACGIDSGVGHSHATQKVTANVAIDANGETELTRRLMRSDKSSQHFHSRKKPRRPKGSKDGGYRPNYKEIESRVQQEVIDLAAMENREKLAWRHLKDLKEVEEHREKSVEDMEKGALLKMPDKRRSLASREESASAASRSPEDEDDEADPDPKDRESDDEADPPASSDPKDGEEDASNSDPSKDRSRATPSPNAKSKDVLDDTEEAQKLADTMSTDQKSIDMTWDHYLKDLNTSEKDMDLR